MTDSLSHPDNTTIRNYLLGSLNITDENAVERHLETCPACAALAIELQPTDALVEFLAAVATRQWCGQHVESAVVDTLSGRRGTTSVCTPDAEAIPHRTELARTPSEPPPAELQDHPRYRVIRLLGRGGMGTVWLAEHLILGRLVALKLLRRDAPDHPSGIARFRREMQAAAALNHPNIATVHDAEQVGPLHLLVMEYVEGETLADTVRRGALSVSAACRAIHDVAQGLAHAHAAGLVHRDIKPGNIMCTRDGTMKLLDFGLVTLMQGGESLTGPNMVMGTPDYIAPEQASDPRRADPRSDIYSLGCTLFHLLTGSVPFPEWSALAKINAHADQPFPELASCPDQLNSIVLRMTNKSPDERFQSVAEVMDALRPFIDESVDSSASVSMTPREKTVTAVSPPAGSAGFTRWHVILLILLPGFLAAGAIFRITTDRGELVIESLDDAVQVIIRQNGHIVRILDTETDRSVVLKSGVYDLELPGHQDQLSLDLRHAEVRRGRKVIATVRRISRPAPAADAVPAANQHITLAPVHNFDSGLRIPSWQSSVAFDSKRRWVYAATDESSRGIARFHIDHAPALRLFDARLAGFSFSLSADGARMAYEDADESQKHVLRVADADDGKIICHIALPEHTGVWQTAFSPDGKLVAATISPSTVTVWDSDSGMVRWTHTFQTGTRNVAFSPDGRLLAVGGEAFALCRIPGDPNEITLLPEGIGVGCSFTPDSLHLIHADGTDGIVRDLASLSIRHRLRGHTSNVESLAAFPDGRHVATGGGDGTIRIWNLQDGRQLESTQSHYGSVLCLAISADGQYLVSGGKDGAVRLWQCRHAEER
jgi:serine/threonine protein kinase